MVIHRTATAAALALAALALAMTVVVAGALREQAPALIDPVATTLNPPPPGAPVLARTTSATNR